MVTIGTFIYNHKISGFTVFEIISGKNENGATLRDVPIIKTKSALTKTFLRTI
jgi:hypothetical protein